MLGLGLKGSDKVRGHDEIWKKSVKAFDRQAES